MKMIDRKIERLTKKIEEMKAERNAMGRFEITKENAEKIRRFNELSDMISSMMDELSNAYFEKMMG